MVEHMSTTFVMHGARTAMESGLKHIEQHVVAIEEAVSDNPGLTFDLAKTLIESACRTILTERRVAFNRGDELPKLFKSVSRCLPFLPTAAKNELEVRKSLSKTLNGLNTAILGICALRNACGFASHGSDRPRPPMEAVQALLAAQTTDAIVAFLHSVHRQDRMQPASPSVDYNKNEVFNDYVDRTNELIRIFELEFRPSEVLFQMEPETYRVILTEYMAESSNDEAAAKDTEQTEAEP